MADTTHKVFLSTGSNLGDRKGNLRIASQRLSQAGVIVKESSLYESEAWGTVSENTYMNQVLELHTSQSPRQLLELIGRIELALGRNRTGKAMEDRTIDIDILLYDEEIVHEPGLQIPHPRMHLRRFALLPLCEIAPNVKHPRLKLSITELLGKCQDKSEVTPLKGEGGILTD